jgi:hypothetical protein
LLDRRPIGLACTMLFVAIVTDACSRLTDVSAPDIVQPSGLANAIGAEALRAGALNSFAIAFAGGGSAFSHVTVSGTMADEYGTASLIVPSLLEADQRVVVDPSSAYPYAAVQRARQAANAAGTALLQSVPSPRPRAAEMLALEGFTELFLAESMCSGVPLGEIVDGRPEFGVPLTSSQLFERALTTLDSAQILAADSARILNLARVGRGRALIGLGRFADAQAAVGAVPTNYVYATEHAAAVQPNGIFEAANSLGYLTVSDREGRNGLDFVSASDPRVRTQLAGKGADGSTNLYVFTRYTSLASPVTLASGVEARLIEAEAALQADNPTRALEILNALRTTVSGLGPLPPAPTQPERVDQLFRERAFWLFATGHRHGDLRRLVRQYRRSTESVFPTGAYRDGRSYGAEVTFAPDATQRFSPNYRGCLDRNA